MVGYLKGAFLFAFLFFCNPIFTSTAISGLKQIRQSISETAARIKDICDKFPIYQHLLSIPGFGPDVSSKVLGAIGDPCRFERGKQVLNLAGLDLSANRSGKRSEMVRPVISKKGKAELRYALY